MRIGLAQIASPDSETPEHRLERVRALLDDIDPGVDLVVLPELWKVGYNHFDDYLAVAEHLDGPTVQTLSTVAARRGCFVHAGSIVQHTAAGKIRNTALLIDPNGRIIHRYSKIHVFGYASREAQLLEAGTSIDAKSTPFGVVAATTCYDIRFPGLWAELVNTGAQLVIVPAAWPAARLAHWRLLTSARAVDNQVFVIACNATGTHGGIELGGHSRIIDPWGTVIAEADTTECVMIADIDPDLVEHTRAEFPTLVDRLDNYAALTR
ncbi:carbon-nitrogen family hydrolase [Mycobacterium paraintracellulare]|uniref:carbon-nitrogen family hydrolase n=1 Tax=Mycobacterium paraintracellulare TaxID=1138383 RepID=UPI001916BB68|nr:carbon-nitrogen family hydrolase [Mycobacterium paraintracellulare]